MKRLLYVILLFTFINMDAQTSVTVDNVNLEKYSGLWYEIARYPQWFEREMTNVTAEYIPQEGFIKVINKGLKKGCKRESEGKAFVVKDSGNSKLKVQFFWPFKGDYWIIGLDKAYNWAVISNQKKSSLWILSRSPEMDKLTLDSILNVLAKRGFDLKRIEFTKQDKCMQPQ